MGFSCTGGCVKSQICNAGPERQLVFANGCVGGVKDSMTWGPFILLSVRGSVSAIDRSWLKDRSVTELTNRLLLCVWFECYGDCVLGTRGFRGGVKLASAFLSKYLVCSEMCMILRSQCPLGETLGLIRSGWAMQ